MGRSQGYEYGLPWIQGIGFHSDRTTVSSPGGAGWRADRTTVSCPGGAWVVLEPHLQAQKLKRDNTMGYVEGNPGTTGCNW